MNNLNNNKNCNDSVESVILKNQTSTIDEVKKCDNQVNHPLHYRTNCPTIVVKCKCGKTIIVPIECIDVIRNMPSWKGNAIKYLWREGLKPDSSLSHKEKTIQDLKKAVWYINDKIKELEKL